ncbi:MAG: AraC family transcriptional regulator [Polyangiaceae bacterium]|nr:AraC family transcriptional regulator [Polyangiaceae bacterium]
MRPAALLQNFPMLAGARGQVWRHQPAYWRPAHFHPEVEINFVSRGWAHIAVGRRTVDVTAGSIVWFLPGQSHELLDGSPDLELWVVGATPPLADAIGCTPHSCTIGRSFHQRLTPSLAAELLDRCTSTVVDGTRSSEQIAASILRSAASAGATQPEPTRWDPLVARALRCLATAPVSSRRSLARVLRVSEAELSRRFHAQLGVPFQHYRHRTRVMEFIDRLGQGQESCLRAAHEAGFGSYSQCLRAFRQVVGCSPRSYLQTGRPTLDGALGTRATDG